jgi:hypothetical protein
MPRLILTGLAIGLDQLTNLVFDKDKPFRCCLICGAVCQTEGGRNAVTEQEVAREAYKRQVWAAKHAKTHSILQHEQLKRSGNTMTPEAANRLVAFGLIPAIDAVTSDEINSALYESSPIPFNDCQS